MPTVQPAGHPLGPWRRSLFAAWAWPLAQVFRTLVALRRWAYDRGLLPSYAAPLVVVSVGGLEAGGSGKTPVAADLVQRLVAAGERVGLLTRGYRRARRGLVVRQPGEPALAAALGDEAAMLVAAGADVTVAACADRVAGAAALAALGCTVAVMDDGFVHRRLRRDVDVVVLRPEAPFGAGHFLPLGSLREAPAALGRAQVVWLHRGVSVLPPVATTEASLAALAAPLFAGLVQLGLRPFPTAQLAQSSAHVLGADAQQVRQGRVWVAAAGLARPDTFAATLAALGAEVAAFVAYPDHHRYGARDVAHLVALAHRHDAAGVAVTAKDAVKLTPLWPPGAPRLLAVRLTLAGGLPDLITQCVKMCADRRRSRQRLPGAGRY